MLIGSTLWVASAVAVGQPAGVAEDDVVRFTRTLDRVAGDQGVSVWLHRAPSDVGWKLRLVDRTRGETVGLASLPEWAGADYYDYDVTVRGFGNVVVLMFDAAPDPAEEAPPGAERYQVAWAYGVKSGTEESVWQQIASTRSVSGTNGDRLVIRKEGRRDTLVRLRASGETRFCGTDEAAFQVFSPSQMAFRSKLDVDALLRDTEEISAELPEEPFQASPYRRFSLWFSATSDQYNVDDSRTVIRPLELGDLRMNTAWSEGATGLGRGEFVTARVNDALKLRAIRLFGGHGGSAELYKAFGSPRRVLVSVQDGRRFEVELPSPPYRLASDRGGVLIELPRPVRTNCLSVVLLDGRAGEPSGEADEAWRPQAVTISEITPISELYGLPPDVAALVVVEKLLKQEDTRQARRLVQLTAPLATELVKVLRNVLRSGSDEDRVRVIPLLRALPSDASVPILVSMFEETEPGEDAYTLLKPAIAEHGNAAARALVEVLEKRTPDNERKYTDLTRLIGRLGTPKELEHLVKRLGEGGRQVRNERVRAISRGGAAMLTPLFGIAAQGVDTERGEDALLAINSIGRKEHYRGQGSHDRASVLLDILGRSKSRRTKLLALKALGFFATPGAVQVLADDFADSKDPLVRRQAIEALTRYTEREARIALEAALFDPSPDVRIAAIDGLSERKDRRQALPSIQRYVDRETWRPGLEAAYTILAELGDSHLLAKMENVIAADPTSDRARLASEALERANHSISGELAGRLIYSPNTDLRMRRNLVDLLGLDDSREGEDVLVDLVHTAEPFSDLHPRQNERLRHRAVLALGRRDSERGREVLLEIVREGASPDLKAIALRALAFSMQKSVVPELQVLRVSAPPQLKDEFDSTIELIQRRADIEELRRGIDEAEDARGDQGKDEKRDD